MGIEPMTSCKLAEVMLSKRSTPELIPRLAMSGHTMIYI